MMITDFFISGDLPFHGMVSILHDGTNMNNTESKSVTIWLSKWLQHFMWNMSLTRSSLMYGFSWDTNLRHISIDYSNTWNSADKMKYHPYLRKSNQTVIHFLYTWTFPRCYEWCKFLCWQNTKYCEMYLKRFMDSITNPWQQVLSASVEVGTRKPESGAEIWYQGHWWGQ